MKPREKVNKTVENLAILLILLVATICFSLGSA